MSTWKEFEKLVLKVQQGLAPHAQVTHNEKIVGRSGTLNQCDVVIRAKVGQYDFFSIIECKDRAKKVGVETVREFQSRLADLGAMKGTIVSAKGFTSGAIQLARNYNINLYKLVDAQSRKWRDEAIIPILVTHIALERVEASLIDTATGNTISVCISKENIPHEYPWIIDLKENRYMRIRELMEKEWDRIFKNHFPERNEIFETERDRYLLSSREGCDLPITVKYKFFPNIKHHYGSIALLECQGLIDQETGELLTNGFLSGPLDFLEAIKKWPHTTERDKVPIKPLFTFFMGKFFERREVPAPRAIAVQMKHN